MSRSLGELIDDFARLSVLVVGEAMLDVYLHGASERLCREAPVPIVDVRARQEAPGAAANVAANVRALGARTALVSVLGDDAEGARLRAVLAAGGVDVEPTLVDPSRRTLAKQRLLAGSQLLARFDQGSTEPVSAAGQRRVVDRLGGLMARQDAVIVSDYGYGVLTPRVIAALARLQAHRPRVLVVDSKTLGAYRGAGVTAVKPNFAEAVRLLDGHAREDGRERIDLMTHHGHRLLPITGARIVAVTLDTQGALFFERGRPPYRTYAEPVEHSRAAGAGDTFGGALALALAAGADVAAAAELASAAASVVVRKTGTATCTAAELRASLSAGKFVADPRVLQARLAVDRARGRRVVLTSGCFDLLHRGHIACLNAAKARGDVLVVGLNSDASIHRLKGADRPINPLEDRAEVLGALSCVDHIVAFDEDTPADLVRLVRPDVFVKGGDYTRDRLPEAAVVEALGGVVQILPYLAERSTSSLITRIREAPCAA